MSDEKKPLALSHVDIFDDLEDGSKEHVARVVPAGDYVAFICQGSKLGADGLKGFSWLTRENAVEFATAILGCATGVFTSPHEEEPQDEDKPKDSPR